MLLVFMIIYLNCDCYRVEARSIPIFNENQLTERIHQSLVDVDRFLENVQDQIRIDKWIPKNILQKDGVRKSINSKTIFRNDDVIVSKILSNSPLSVTSKITPQKTFLRTPIRHFSPSINSSRLSFEDPAVAINFDGRSSDPEPYPDHYVFSAFPLTTPAFLSPKVEDVNNGNNEVWTLESTTAKVEESYQKSVTKIPNFKDIGNDPYRDAPSNNEAPPVISGVPDNPGFSDVNILRTFSKNLTDIPNSDRDIPGPKVQHRNLTLYLQQKFLKLMNISAREQYQWLFVSPTTEILEMNGTGSTTDRLDHLRIFPTTRREMFPPPTPFTMGTPPPVMETTVMVQHGNVILEDEHGMPYLGTTPEEDLRTIIMPDGRIIVVPPGVDMSWATPTTAGDVLDGRIKVATPSPHDIYKQELHAEMDRDNVGYMHVFLVRLFYLVASKKKEDVRSVLQNVEPIMFKMFEERRVVSWGEPLLRITMSLAIAVSEGETDVIQSYASMLHFMLRNRKETAAPDVNDIIENYESLFKESEGELLFDILKEFEDYPNIERTPYDLCNAMIQRFLQPLQRLSNSQRRQDLIDSINYALSSRFPRFKSVKIADVTPLTSPALPVNATEVRNQTEGSHRRNFRNHQSNHLRYVTNARKFRRSRNKTKLNYRRRTQRRDLNSDFNYEKLLHSRANGFLPDGNQRNIQRTTRIQKRFNQQRSTASRHLPIKKHRAEPRAKVNHETEFTTDNKLRRINNGVNRNRKNMNSLHKFRGNRPILNRQSHLTSEDSNHDGGSEMESKVTDVGSDYETEDIDEKSKDQKKVNILRKIVDDSSYSDEEEALQNNLISALIHGNRTFEMEVINEATPRPMRAITEKNKIEIGFKRKN